MAVVESRGGQQRFLPTFNSPTVWQRGADSLALRNTKLITLCIAQKQGKEAFSWHVHVIHILAA